MDTKVFSRVRPVYQVVIYCNLLEVFEVEVFEECGYYFLRVYSQAPFGNHNKATLIWF